MFLCVGMPSFYNLITLNFILNPINMPHGPQCEVKGGLNIYTVKVDKTATD